MTKKLYEIPRNQPFLLETDNGKEAFTFHHVDGMYSLFTRNSDGAPTHIIANAEVTNVDNHYELV